MAFQLKETSYDRAWRVIRAMQTEAVFNEFIIICRISCYLKQTDIEEKIRQYGYADHALPVKQFKKTFPLNLLPVPGPNYFYLYDAGLCRIHDLALSCNDFLMFEILFADRESIQHIKKSNLFSNNTLYDGLNSFVAQCKRYFFCGFDFDDPYFESGVSQALRYSFVPDFLSVYFQQA